MRWVVLTSIPLTSSFFIISPDIYMGSDLFTTIIVSIIWIILLPVSCIYAQIYRYRKVSTADERHQTKWIMYGLALWIGFIVVSSIPFLYLTNLPPDAPSPWWAPISSLGWWVSVNILPLSFTIAVTRSKLWNIDIVINRTLVYGGLTILTLGFYVFVVGYLGNLIQAVDQSLIAFIATGIIAVLFQPLRARIQGTVNRMMYGNRDDPVAVLSELGEKLEQTGSPEDALSSIVEIIPRTLKLPFAAIELGEQVTSYGIQNSEVVKLPLTYQSNVIGHLTVGLRSPGESFSSADIKLLENIAHRAGAAAHAVKLTADLRQSRLKLVTLREEERRRIRRDLHDGLGPTLASQTLKLDAIRNSLRESPKKAVTLIDELKDQTLETIQDIRNLVYDLRPPALDEMGLIGAIQNFIEAKPSDHLEVRLITPDRLPTLSAALEVVVYRTVLEGITNVLHHAQAETVEIKIEVKEPHLIIEITDDGDGLPEDVSLGVGLVSMQERADELGGKFKLRSNHPGVHIQVSFPLPLE
jgi:signal transduction histidine kinase